MTGKIKWLVLGLVLSLAANIFVGGLMLGKTLRHAPPPRGAPPEIDFNIKRLSQFMTKEERRKVRKILGAQRSKFEDRYSSVRKSETRIKELMSAEQVDRVALLAALEAHGDLMRQMHAPMQRAMMEVIAELRQETRAKMADEMFKRNRRLRMRGGEARFGPDGRRGPHRAHGPQSGNMEDKRLQGGPEKRDVPAPDSEEQDTPPDVEPSNLSNNLSNSL